MKMYRIVKRVKVHVNQLAAMSRKFTVKNITKSISPVVEHKRIYGDVDNAVTNPFTGHKFVPENPHPVPGRFGITITGYDWIELPGMLWEHKRYKQPKNLRKKYKKEYYFRGSKDIRKIVEHPSDYDAFKNYPYTLPKMNRVEYMEKLVEHKLAKWERKHPQPMDMFVEDVEKWKQERETAKERFRDFVVSIYDPLPLTGRFVIARKNSATYIEEEVAKIKDINEEGHKVNELKPDSKLLKKAQKVTNQVKAKRPALVCTNLKDHKRQKGRIILPQAA